MNGDLFAAMLAAHEAKDDRFYRLCEQNAQWIEDNWAEWTRASPADMARFRGDPAAMQRRGQFLLAIAQRLDLIGHRGPMDIMRGVTGGSPISRFEQALSDARQHAERGDHRACRATLLAAVHRLDGLTGADHLLVTGHVELALCAARTGDLGSAAQHIRTAREHERKAGDRYFSLTTRYFGAFTTHDDAEVVAVRGSIAHAQLLSDNGDFRASNTELESLLHRAGDYLGKVHGLLGLNHHLLGDRIKAQEHTTLALAECERRSDAAGIAVYTANLVAIRR